jgi:hypothetical protein
MATKVSPVIKYELSVWHAPDDAPPAVGRQCMADVWTRAAVNNCNGPIREVHDLRKSRVGPRLPNLRAWAATNNRHLCPDIRCRCVVSIAALPLCRAVRKGNETMLIKGDIFNWYVENNCLGSLGTR